MSSVPDFSGTTWVKSSYSEGNGGECVEVAPGFPGLLPVRDSKNPEGPALVFPASAWSAFITDVKAGRFSA
ncbi:MULTISPECIES: DUF397 domain-containing protein [unclassified Streptomyces]|uniref:DUF397 domain-containing protein n=1 Tax=unclassified Streptomyces TaxID=2593676 RepID=UPI002E2B125A|nr:DUF397 domain-containing protein [Streptomyces sp. NBC_00223]